MSAAAKLGSAFPGGQGRKLSSLAVHSDVAESIAGSIAAIKLSAPAPPTTAAATAAAAAPPNLLLYATAPSPVPRSPTARAAAAAGSPTAARRAASSRFDSRQDDLAAGGVAAALRPAAFDVSGRAIPHSAGVSGAATSAPLAGNQEAPGGCWCLRFGW